jgi:hypothetical protein
MEHYVRAMAIVFLLLIVVFAIVATCYLFANNFARETLDVLYPAIGAILLSLYLGFKLVWLDQPLPKRFRTTVAVLHDSQNGEIRGMAPRTLRHLPRLGELKGCELIDDIPRYNAFQTVPIREQLRDPTNAPNSPAKKMVRQIVEYGILEWLAKPEQTPGFSPSVPVQLITGGGSVGGIPGNLIQVQVESIPPDRNPLLTASPISLRLPKGSSAQVFGNDDTIVAVTTKNSRVQFEMREMAWELIGGPIGRDAERIHSALGLPANPQGLGIYGLPIEVTATQRPFSRFSRQAKVEAEWFTMLDRRLEADFSWDRLRALYISE